MSGPVSETQVRLDRDALATPWGVRLQGGRDFKQPLTVQRVFVGSPADGELHRGDVLVSIENYDASGLSHKQAHDIFRNAGGSISLRIRRAAGSKSVGFSGAAAPATLSFSQTNQSYRSRPLDAATPKPAPALGAFSPPQTPGRTMPLYGGAGPNYGADYSAHGGGFHPQQADPMLSRVQASLNEALWTPGDMQGDPEDCTFRSVRDAKQQFQQPGYNQRPVPFTPGQSRPQYSSQNSGGGSAGRKWRRPEGAGGPGCLTEPGWTPKPKAPTWGSNRGAPAAAPSRFTPVSPPSQVPVNASYGSAPQEAPRRPAWAGTLKSSGGPKPWEVQAGESLIPPGEESSVAYQAPAQQRQPAAASPGGGGGGGAVVPHKPRVQSMHYGPGGSQEYRQNDPALGADSARVVHSQYNTPLGLYSKQNVNDMLQAQTAGMPGQGTMQVTGGDSKKTFNPAQSDVYRLLQEEEGGGGRSRGGRGAQAARYTDQAGPEIQYDGYQDQSVQSPSMQALESRYGGGGPGEDYGTSDF